MFFNGILFKNINNILKKFMKKKVKTSIAIISYKYILLFWKIEKCCFELYFIKKYIYYKHILKQNEMIP